MRAHANSTARDDAGGWGRGLATAPRIQQSPCKPGTRHSRDFLLFVGLFLIRWGIKWGIGRKAH